MRAKILIAFMLAAVCAASKEDWDAFISPVDKYEPNGKLKFAVNVEDSNFDQNRLNAALNDPYPEAIDKIVVNSVELEDIRRIFELHGKQATKLSFGAGNLTYKAQDIIDALNILPNLEELTFDVKDSSIESEAFGTLNLKNLNTLNVRKEGSVFLSKILPENIVKDFTIFKDQNYGELLKKQQSLKNFSIGFANPVIIDPLKTLKLDKLIVHTETYDVEFLQNRRDFIKAVIATQPNLTFLGLEFSTIGDTNIINDELLVEISKLSKLENFMFLMEGPGLTNLEPLGNLKSLKDLTPMVFNYKENSNYIELFRKLSNVKFESVEDLEFYWCYTDCLLMS